MPVALGSDVAAADEAEAAGGVFEVVSATVVIAEPNEDPALQSLPFDAPAAAQPATEGGASDSGPRRFGFLPLTAFDVISDEFRCEQELLAQRGETATVPRARSRYFALDGSYEWRPCTVLLYNADRQLYLIEWDDGHARKWAGRYVVSSTG